MTEPKIELTLSLTADQFMCLFGCIDAEVEHMELIKSGIDFVGFERHDWDDADEKDLQDHAAVLNQLRSGVGT